MAFSALLFDLDGTLVESVGLYEKALIKAFTAFGVPMTPKEYLEWYTAGKHVKEMMEFYKIDSSEESALRKLRDETYIALLRTESRWLPGAEAFLKETAGYPRAIITGSWRSYVQAIDENLGVLSHIPHVITADEIHDCMKPAPDGLLMAAEILGVDPTTCIYIGDQNFDIGAAKNAGMKSCFIKSAYGPKTLPLEPDFHVSSLQEISAIL